MSTSSAAPIFYLGEALSGEDISDYVASLVEGEGGAMGRRRREELVSVRGGRQPWLEEVVDEQGRRRFHGAFTGGFSAGHFNTVGSEGGFVPSTFVSTRGAKRAHHADHQAELMLMRGLVDEEDLRDGIDPLAQRQHYSRGEVLEPARGADILRALERASAPDLEDEVAFLVEGEVELRRRQAGALHRWVLQAMTPRPSTPSPPAGVVDLDDYDDWDVMVNDLGPSRPMVIDLDDDEGEEGERFSSFGTRLDDMFTTLPPALPLTPANTLCSSSPGLRPTLPAELRCSAPQYRELVQFLYGQSRGQVRQPAPVQEKPRPPAPLAALRQGAVLEALQRLTGKAVPQFQREGAVRAEVEVQGDKKQRRYEVFVAALTGRTDPQHPYNDVDGLGPEALRAELREFGERYRKDSEPVGLDPALALPLRTEYNWDPAPLLCKRFNVKSPWGGKVQFVDNKGLYEQRRGRVTSGEVIEHESAVPSPPPPPVRGEPSTDPGVLLPDQLFSAIFG